MENKSKEQKFNVGDTVYYVRFYNEHGKIYKGTITGVDQRLSEHGVSFKYYIDNNRFSESDLFSKQSEVIGKAIHELLDNLSMDEEKVEYICQYLFPDEEDEVTEADFNTVAPEPLQIPEKTGFFKNLFK